MIRRAWIFFAPCVFASCTCSRKEAAPSFPVTPASTGAGSAVPAPGARPAKIPVPPRDPELARVVKISTQADQVLREAWRVVADEKRSAPRSAFGKVQRAALQAMDGKLATKGLFQCDRYTFRRVLSPVPHMMFSEHCSEKAGEKEIATWTATGSDRAKVEFVPQNLGEVLGLSASIFGRRLTCELKWNADEILTEMSCPGWEQDRRTHLVHLDVFEFKKENHDLLTLKGKLMENLQAVRKIEAQVPLEGKIVVTETELNAPIAVQPLVPPIAKPPAAAAGRAGPPPAGAAPPENGNAAPTVEADPNAPSPVDPDLMIQRRRSGVGRNQAAPPMPKVYAPDGTEVFVGGAVDGYGRPVTPSSTNAAPEAAQSTDPATGMPSPSSLEPGSSAPVAPSPEPEYIPITPGR